jgi:hypothetical protein
MIVIRKDKTVNSEILPYLAHVRLSLIASRKATGKTSRWDKSPLTSPLG